MSWSNIVEQMSFKCHFTSRMLISDFYPFSSLVQTYKKGYCTTPGVGDRRRGGGICGGSEMLKLYVKDFMLSGELSCSGQVLFSYTFF